MGLSYNVYLNSNRIYGCKNCKTHLSNHEDILSRVHAPPHLLLCFPERLVGLVASLLTLGGHNFLELPWPTWKSLPLQYCRQH